MLLPCCPQGTYKIIFHDLRDSRLECIKKFIKSKQRKKNFLIVGHKLRKPILENLLRVSRRGKIPVISKVLFNSISNLGGGFFTELEHDGGGNNVKKILKVQRQFESLFISSQFLSEKRPKTRFFTINWYLFTFEKRRAPDSSHALKINKLSIFELFQTKSCRRRLWLTSP